MLLLLNDDLYGPLYTLSNSKIVIGDAVMT